jgi:AraC-like DNA-binding protein
VANAFHPHLITRGHGIFQTDGGEVTIGPGDMFVLWPGTAHYFREDPDDPWHFYWIRLQGEDTEQVVRAMGYGPKSRLGRPEDVKHAIRAAQALFEHYGSHHRDSYHAASLLFDFVAACRKPDAVDTGRQTDARLVQEARAVVESLLETGVNVSTLAEQLRVTRQALLAAFKNEADTTPTEYIQRRRLERAQRLLVETDRKIGAVSRACGYGNEKYFYRRFRELTGHTPGQWRQDHRGAG